MKNLAIITWEWAVRSFGSEHVTNPRIRALRLAEETVELAQSLDVTAEQLHKLIDVVYSRPVGEAYKEVGGVMVTLSILCTTLGLNPEKMFEIELRRVLSKPTDFYTERNQEKIDLGLD